MNPLPEILWHGTNDFRLRLILEAGVLDPAHATLQASKISLTSRRDVALHFASEKCHADRFEDGTRSLVLLGVPSASLDPAHLLPDPLLMAEAQAPERAGDDRNPFGRGYMRFLIRAERNETASWQSSFEICDCVNYSACIPITPAMVDVSASSIAAQHIPRPNDLAPAEPVFVADPLDWIRQRA